MATSASWGLVCAVEKSHDNQDGWPTYIVKQQTLAGVFPDATLLDENYLGGELIGIGPVDITPFVDLNAKQVGVSISVLGIGIGTYYISFSKGGLVVHVDVKAANGSLTFSIHDGFLWVRRDIKVFGHHYGGVEHQVIKIPRL